MKHHCPVCLGYITQGPRSRFYLKKPIKDGETVLVKQGSARMHIKCGKSINAERIGYRNEVPHD